MEEQPCKRILVVDSQPETRETCLVALRRKGFELAEAGNTQEGLESVQLNPPDLVICDAHTDSSGKISLVKVLQTHPDTAIIPIIILLAPLTRMALHKAVVMGVSGYLVKPCKPEEMLQVVSTQLKKQAYLRDYYLRSQPQDAALSSLSQMEDQEDSPLSQALQFISDNHTQSIALSDVAQFVGYSPSYLTTQMREKTGQTIQQWIIQLRMSTACSLLSNTSCSVEEVANQVGYHNATHFFRQFRRLYGTTPRAWRNRQR